MKTSYREPDYAFGQTMLTLRTKIGLTQEGLANLLGISRRSVGEWEAGNSYPKSEHLKKLITLALKSQAWPKGSEAKEIRALWILAHQKVQLNEHWLSALLEQERSLHLHLVSTPTEESTIADVGVSTGADVGQGFTPSPYTYPPVMTEALPGPRVDWGDALAIPTFYGREQELTQLTQWVAQEHCQVVSVLGMGGIGKSALSTSLMHRLAEHFEVIIFRSLRDALPCEALLDGCLQVLSPQLLSISPTPIEQRISLLLEQFRTYRVFLLLDNLECLLQEEDSRGRFRPGFEGYGQLLRRVAETKHQSCLLITSREEPTELRPLKGKHSLVQSLRLSGLELSACKQLCADKQITGTEGDQERLVEIYGGNPLALKIVAESISDLFSSEIGLFLRSEMLAFGSISDLLDEQFARLSTLERSVLCWLAIAREPMTFDELQAMLVTPLPRVQLLEAVDGLHRRSLIERGKRAGSFTLQSVVLEYVTLVLVAAGSREIQQHRLDTLTKYGLTQAQAKEYVRQTQLRLLLSPLLMDLRSARPRQVDIQGQLLSLLNDLRKRAVSAQGYGPANLIALLRLLRGNLNGMDLSQLSIRGAYFQDVEMQDTKLSRALIQDSVFTQAVGAPFAVAIRLDGKLWAVGSLQGQVHVWEGIQSQTLRLSLAAHTDAVQALAFSPDGKTLASGSLDGTVKLWEVDSGILLWTDKQQSPFSLAFTPDGALLASGGVGVARLWDARSGMSLQTMAHAGQVFAVAFSPDGCLLASGCVDGQICLWERQKGTAPTYASIRSVQSNWVLSLTFAPDGRTLASTSTGDQMVRLWEVESLQLLQTLPGYADQSRCVTWSHDGAIIAYCGSDKAIWLWDVRESRCRATLHGHTADIYGLAFTPDDNALLSGSADNTLRVWDVNNYRCMHIVIGYAVAFWDLDWSPDGTHLISGRTDALVTVWDLSGRMSPTILQGHSGIVLGVGWSPDGRFLASCGLDAVLLLRDSTSFSCIQRFEDHFVRLVSMAWSPDGSFLACGTYGRGIQVWDMATRSLHYVGQTYPTAFHCVTWSPNGRQLVGGGEGCVYLWERADEIEQGPSGKGIPYPVTAQTMLSGHHGWVRDVGWSPDGKRLASCGGTGDHGELFVWDVQSYRGGQGQVDRGKPLSLQVPTPLPVQTFAVSFGVVHALAWNLSGNQLISGGSDGILRWWDVLTGKCVRTQEAHQGTIQFLKVSPDGTRLASCGDDGAIMIWDLTVGTGLAPVRLQTLRHDRPYERLDITGIRGLNVAQIASLQALGAIEREAVSSP